MTKDITEEELIGHADRAMYLAKRQGRNKVIIYNKELEVEANRKTLLIVDDESAILKLLRDKLSSLGYHVVTAKNGYSAINLSNQMHPDAVILDLILPDIDGFEVCKRIKGNRSTALTKVIILSKKQEKETIAKGLYVGADDYITKPFSMVELEARIMKVLNQ